MRQILTAADLRREIGRANRLIRGGFRWSTVPPENYTREPLSTSVIAVPGDPSDIAPLGLPIKYQYGDVEYYGVVSAVTDGQITVAGAPLDTSMPIQSLWLGQPEGAVRVSWKIPGSYGASASDILDSINHEYARWEQAPAFVASFGVRHRTAATTTQPKINLKFGGSLISTNDSGNGLQVETSWVLSGVTMNSATYRIERGAVLEVRCTVAGSGGTPAGDLSVSVTMVLE
jgi:hypothetical protein